jgi:hypothetical protein
MVSDDGGNGIHGVSPGPHRQTPGAGKPAGDEADNATKTRQVAAAQRLAASANGAPAVSDGGGAEFMVFRRDRIACTQRAEHLRAMRLTGAAKTRQMIAGGCATPMHAGFDDKDRGCRRSQPVSAPVCAGANADLHALQTLGRGR